MDEFPCTKCGLCCKHVGDVLSQNSIEYKTSPTVIKDLINSFPYKVNEDGSCSMLTEEGLCKVYENRPIICNVRLGAKLLNIPLKDWYKDRAKGCNDLIRKAGLSNDYLVQIEETSEKINKITDQSSKLLNQGKSSKNFKKRIKNHRPK